MRILSVVVFSIFFFLHTRAQVTLVREAPNDSFDLSCPKCTMTVADVAITKGQHAIPMNMKKPVAMNLLMWKYYDDILKRETLMSKEPFWTKGTLLLDEVPESEMLSLHVNLIWTDSNALEHRFYLVAAGLTRSQLSKPPVISVFDPDTYAPQRFNGIAQISNEAGEWGTYDAIEGTFTLDSLNTQTGSIKGSFEFTGNRVGMEQLGFFMNGAFQR